MKLNKYQLAAAGIAVVIIVIGVFTQRSDWDANKFILSADGQGNLAPRSEKYFDDKEKALIATVKQKIDAALSGMPKIVEWIGPHNGASCRHGAEGHRPTNCIRRGHCRHSIQCPGSAVAVQVDSSGRDRCACATFTL